MKLNDKEIKTLERAGMDPDYIAEMDLTGYPKIRREEKVDECGCKLVRDETGLRVEDCLLHKAAPDLLEACKMALVQIKQDNDARNVKDDYRGTEWQLKGVISKAEGKD